MSTAPDRVRAPRPPASEIVRAEAPRRTCRHTSVARGLRPCTLNRRGGSTCRIDARGFPVGRELAVLRDAELGRARPIAGVTAPEATAVPVTDPGADHHDVHPAGIALGDSQPAGESRTVVSGSAPQAENEHRRYRQPRTLPLT